MEIIFIIIDVILLVVLLGIPFILIWFTRKSKLKYGFLSYFILTVFTTIIFVFFTAWIESTSIKIALNHYGYNFDAMSNSERYKNISIENLEKAHSLERNYLGIGWSIKAIFGSVIFLPYSLLVFVIGFFLVRRKTKLNS